MKPNLETRTGRIPATCPPTLRKACLFVAWSLLKIGIVVHDQMLYGQVEVARAHPQFVRGSVAICAGDLAHGAATDRHLCRLQLCSYMASFVTSLLPGASNPCTLTFHPVVSALYTVQRQAHRCGCAPHSHTSPLSSVATTFRLRRS